MNKILKVSYKKKRSKKKKEYVKELVRHLEDRRIPKYILLMFYKKNREKYVENNT